LVTFEQFNEKAHAFSAHHVWAEQAILRPCAGTNRPLGQVARIGKINPVDAARSGVAQPRDEVADIKEDLSPHYGLPGIIAA
jgi:hypothetical protein